MEKAHRERTVFLNFLRAVGWPYDESLISSRRPPEPDILYAHPELGPIAFELSEFCSPKFAQLASTGKGFAFGSDPTAYVLLKKISNYYHSKFPIELLCFEDGRTVMPIDIDNARHLIESHNSHFRRIWIWGRNKIWLQENGHIREHSA